MTESPAPSSLSSSYASPPPDLLGTEGRMRKGEQREEEEDDEEVGERTERCKSRQVSEGAQSG